jgi:UDP-glucuronate 4-epimerase
MAIHSFARRILAGEDVPVYGPGDSRRDYTYVSDVVDAVVRCVERDEAWGVYNIGGAHTVPLMEMIETLARALGRPARVRHEPPHPADPPATHACVERARRVLGWAPAVPFEDGVRRFAEWIRSGP